jgi:hypothetical protein
MLNIENKAKFETLVSEAIEKVAMTVNHEGTARRWVNAIAKAATQIEENGDFMTYDETENHLVIWSQSTNEIYSANGVCQCKAFAQGSPCWHRAAARLVRLYNEAKTAPTAREMAAAPYIKPSSGKRPERVGNYSI